MGFLSGVLGAVKDENEVTTYDKYITNEENKLNKVLEKLTKNIGSGRTGLVASVGAVKEWLEGYEGEVNEKINEVTNPLNTLISEIDKRKNRLENYKQKEYDDIKEEDWYAWSHDIKNLRGHCAVSIDNLNALDPKLSGELTTHVDMVSQAVQTFVENSKRDRKELENINYKISEQLMELQREITSKANHKGDECIKALRNAFKEKIQDPIKRVQKTLNGILQNLHAWITVVNNVLNAVIKTADDVHKAMDPEERNKKGIGQDIGVIDRSKGNISRVIEGLNEVDAHLGTWIGKAGSVLEGAKQNVADILKEVNNENNEKHSSAIRTAAYHLKQDAENLLMKMQSAHKHIKTQIDAAIMAFAQVEAAVKKDLGKLRDEIRSTVTSYFGQLAMAKFEKGAGKNGIDMSKLNNLQSEKFKTWLTEAGKTSFNIMMLHEALMYFKRPHNVGDVASPYSGISAFAAMAEDAAAKVDEDYGVKGDYSKMDNHITSYKSREGKGSVSEPLGLIQGSDGLGKIDNVKSTGKPGASISANYLRDLYKQVHSNLQRLIDAIRNLAGEKHANDGLKQKLERLQMLLDFSTTDKFVDVDGEKMHGLGKVRSDSRGYIASLSGQPALIEGATQRINKELKRLQGVLKSTENNKEAVIQCLEDLRNYGLSGSVIWAGKNVGGLGKIHNDVMDILGISKKPDPTANLTKIIEEAEHFYSETIGQTVVECIAGITSFLSDQVTDKIKNLKKAALTQFANRKTAELETLKSLVSTQISAIEHIINTDSASGLKGLMNKLHGTFTKHNLENVSNVSLELFSNKAKEFFNKFYNDFKTQHDILPDQGKLTPLAGALSSLLTTMNTKRHFSADVSSRLADLQAQLTALTPSGFAEASPLLNVVKAGVQAFHGELAKQYVSRYAGREVGEMVKQKTSPDPKAPRLLAKLADDTEITEYGRKCAKVFLTCLATLSNDFVTLGEKCKGANFQTIYASNEKITNVLGDYLISCGYKVSMSRESHEGELRNKPMCEGQAIYMGWLNKNIETAVNLTQVKTWKEEQKKANKFTHPRDTDVTKVNLLDILGFLYECLETYYSVSHLRHIERPKSPSSVYDMLRWLTGLPHNRVNSTVSVGDIAQLFEKADEAANDAVDGSILVVDDDESLSAYPTPVTAANIRDALQKVCVDAEDVLTSILGHGHADGIYAVDFNTNPDGFSYPTAPGACFDMLADILCRLYQQLYFLYRQCSNDESCAGWLNCWYGQGVGGSSFNCNTRQCANQICDQKANQKRDQIHEQMGDQHPNCGLKSPLQSFLEDGLPGFLPHQFDKPGCKLTCTYSNHRGLPCKTPMGFADISVMASHTQNGAYLKKVLKAFCGSDTAPLTQLCAQLTCLLQKPPQTLGDIFAFYYSYLKDWAGDYYGIKNHGQHTQRAFGEAVNAAYFGTQYGDLDPKALCSSKSHNDEHTKGDLCSVTTCTTGSDKPCGLYVKPIAQKITTYYASDHKGNHLSWMVYITETFYDLLKKLYDECCANCDKKGTRCNDKRCVETCGVKYSDKEEEKQLLKEKCHKPDCKSIITCRNTHPTLYKYGFTFGNPWALNGLGKDTAAKRTCKDLCEALKLMLGKDSVLITLREQIDNFLWAIKLNFSITVLALWLLSLLYLLHIMVIRLDLLHIKSHLRSPSTHRIAAQSLLAAGRVNKLNRVFYLQP